MKVQNPDALFLTILGGVILMADTLIAGSAVGAVLTGLALSWGLPALLFRQGECTGPKGRIRPEGYLGTIWRFNSMGVGSLLHRSSHCREDGIRNGGPADLLRSCCVSGHDVFHHLRPPEQEGPNAQGPAAEVLTDKVGNSQRRRFFACGAGSISS